MLSVRILNDYLHDFTLISLLNLVKKCSKIPDIPSYKTPQGARYKTNAIMKPGRINTNITEQSTEFLKNNFKLIFLFLILNYYPKRNPIDTKGN